MQLTKLSRVLMRASNSCSPMRLLCRGPKVEPAQPTVPVGLGLWMVRSSRIRLFSPPAEHKAVTLQQHKKKEQMIQKLRFIFLFSNFYFMSTHLSHEHTFITHLVRGEKT